MPYIEKASSTLLKKEYSDGEILQTRRMKAASQLIVVNSDRTYVNVTDFSISEPAVYCNGLKLDAGQFTINRQVIYIPTLKEGDRVEVIQSLDKPDAVDYFPLYYSENIEKETDFIILPWTYNNELRNITIYKNGSLLDRSEYDCTRDDVVTFHEGLKVGDRLVFYSSVPSVNSDLYGEYFNTFPILGVLDCYGEVPPAGFVEMNGQELMRSEYPTAWLKLTDRAIADSDWLGNPDNRDNFSQGNGVTTFRVPVEKSDKPNCIRCVKLYSAIVNPDALDVYGIQKDVRTLIKRFDSRTFSRNLLINGSCAINTRGNLPKSVGVEYCLDRWLIWRNLADASVSQETESEGKTVSRRFMRVHTYTSEDEGCGISLQYRLENVLWYSNRNLVFSFKGKADKVYPVFVELYLNFGSGGHVEERGVLGEIVSVKTSWNRVGVKFQVPDLSIYQIDTSGGYLGIALWLSASPEITHSGGVRQKEAIFDFTDFQLEEGTVMTEYDLIPASQEMSQCQYYCRKFKTRQDTEELSWSMRSVPLERIKDGNYIYDSEIY